MLWAFCFPSTGEVWRITESTPAPRGSLDQHRVRKRRGDRDNASVGHLRAPDRRQGAVAALCLSSGGGRRPPWAERRGAGRWRPRLRQCGRYGAPRHGGAEPGGKAADGRGRCAARRGGGGRRLRRGGAVGGRAVAAGWRCRCCRARGWSSGGSWLISLRSSAWRSLMAPASSGRRGPRPGTARWARRAAGRAQAAVVAGSCVVCCRCGGGRCRAEAVPSAVRADEARRQAAKTSPKPLLIKLRRGCPPLL